MTNREIASTAVGQWQVQADSFMAQGSYAQAAAVYEQAIAAEPEVRSHYWHLGLVLLLQGQEAEAQTAWLVGMADGEPAQIEQWMEALRQILQAEAERQEAQSSYSLAWLIRQHWREICPEDGENLLHLVRLSAQLEQLTVDALDSLAIIPQLRSAPQGTINCELLLQALGFVLAKIAPDRKLLEFTEACLAHVPDLSEFRAVLLPEAIRIGYAMGQKQLAIDLLELALRFDVNNLEILGHLASLYQNLGDYDRGIEVARLRYQLSEALIDKVFSNYLILRGLMSAGGYWQEALVVLEQHEQLLAALVAECPADLERAHIARLLTTTYFSPYFRDDLRKNRSLQNQIVALGQANMRQYAREETERYQQSRLTHRLNHASDPGSASKVLKVGYLSYCMGNHSVGELARWLMKYHDRSQFQLYGYFINERHNDPLYEWYLGQMNHVCRMGVECPNRVMQLAERIHQDQLDLLIDLDSMTLDLTCEILAVKPAPIQVTWLGWDAAGLPAVDYFIADPYVLPDWAQEYYPERIWRLPQTYIAVDGFEVAVPTLRRDQLGIPSDAVVYFSSQRGYKRHRETAKLQMQILRSVPNSYFLIKGLADQQSIQTFFIEIAEAEGVSPDRLRFLPYEASEKIHRANLGIADVVLDTYPYNGATTTLETLWMGVPLVTRAGEQFASRNSYTMLVNAGITEGIAWTDEAYVEWGVRLGKDPELRQQIAWKLRQSRKTASLWNAKQFTREVEAAYRQMWNCYLQGG